jgi:transcriptional regulator
VEPDGTTTRFLDPLDPPWYVASSKDSTAQPSSGPSTVAVCNGAARFHPPRIAQSRRAVRFAGTIFEHTGAPSIASVKGRGVAPAFRTRQMTANGVVSAASESPVNAIDARPPLAGHGASAALTRIGSNDVNVPNAKTAVAAVAARTAVRKDLRGTGGDDIRALRGGGLTFYRLRASVPSSIDGSVRMARRESPDLLPGTLDLLILRIVSAGSTHGYGIAQRLKLLSNDVLQVGESSLYPALQRLLLDGYLEAEWGASENNRRARYYTLTRAGRRHLAEERREFDIIISAIQHVLEMA